MRKLFAFFLCVLLLFSLVACGGTSESGESSSEPVSSESQESVVSDDPVSSEDPVSSSETEPTSTAVEASDATGETSIATATTTVKVEPSVGGPVSTTATRSTTHKKITTTKGVKTTVSKATKTSVTTSATAVTTTSATAATTTTTQAPQEEKIVICWGDSLTEGMGMQSGKYAYPTVLQSLLGDGYAVWNGGYSGDTSYSIMARQGSLSLTTKEDIAFGVGVNKVEIGTKRGGMGFMRSDGEELTRMNVYAGLVSGNAALLRVSPLKIGGKTYQFGYSLISGTSPDSDFTLTLSRADASKALTIPAGTKVQLGGTDMSAQSDCEIILMGANDGGDMGTVIDRYQAMIDYMQHDHYLAVVPYWTHDYDEAFSKAFGEKAVFFGEEIAKRGLDELGITPTSVDSGMMNKKMVPVSLRYENRPAEVHLNEYGYKMLATILYERGQQLGYWK